MTVDDVIDFHVGALRHGGMGEVKIGRDVRGYTVEVRPPDPDAPAPTDPLSKVARLAAKVAKYLVGIATECATCPIEKHDLAKEAALGIVNAVPFGAYE